jgi:hypothetical protein
MNERVMSEIPAPEGPLRRDRPLYFGVSIPKLLVLSVVTFGMYEVYWFYQHWRVYKERTGARITPIARSFFAEFFCYSLFRHIRQSAEQYGVRAGFSPGLLAIGWVVLMLSARAPGMLSLLSILSPLMLVPVQNAANRLNEQEAPDHPRNDRFTGWNIALIVIWVLLFILGIVGSFLPSQPQQGR